MGIKFKKKKIEGVVEIIPETYKDDRGFLTHLNSENIFMEEGHHHTFKKHTLRGLHISLPPFSESKFLYVTRGKMFWVVVDIRKRSKTFGQWESFILSESRKNILVTTPGFAHGCLSLTDNVDLIFKSDKKFSEKHGTGIIWNDKDLKIDWNLKDVTPLVSKRDKSYSSFEEFKRKYGNGI